VLINQATAATGLPGCPTTGFPIVICHPGSYRLSGNLSISNADVSVIQIAAAQKHERAVQFFKRGG
jgi:hypothetical protein